MTDLTTSALGIRHDPSSATEGSSQTLVLVNSLGTTTRMWDQLLEVLTARVDVVRFELRGHGSNVTRTPFGLDDLVDDLVEVLDATGVDRAHLAGISLGGMTAIRAAARFPGRVASLAVICAAPVLPRDTWLQRAAAVRAAGLGPLVPTVTKRWFTEAFVRRSPEVVRAFVGMLRATDPAGYSLACDLLADADVRPDLPSITAPTLVIGGREDTATPPSDQRLIAHGIADARLMILDDVAHMAPAAAPERIASAMLDHTGSPEMPGKSA
ncbi:alpha/beta fold hydrolase [Jiangella anatolica]|uniref:alpha/beta fold hydrolase n=1 Tax=Jiangella anatolica TaxID=2670374 RepID=UPI001314CBB1|nr:alpha/beta fold hydrolase [Jiangella anatolica]